MRLTRAGATENGIWMLEVEEGDDQQPQPEWVEAVNEEYYTMNDESSVPKDFFDVIANRHAESGQAGWSDDDYGGENGTEAVDKDQMY